MTVATQDLGIKAEQEIAQAWATRATRYLMHARADVANAERRLEDKKKHVEEGEKRFQDGLRALESGRFPEWQPMKVDED